MSNEKPVKNTPNQVTLMSMSGMKLPKPSIQPSAAVPPGLSSPQEFPPLAAPQPVAPPKLQKKVTGSNLVLGTIKPVVPVLPGQQSRTLVPTKENRETLISQKLADISGASCSTEHESVIEATVARPSAKPKLRAKQSAIGSSRKNAQSKSSSSEVPAPNAAAAAEPKFLSISASENSQKLTEARPHPGKLDITAAKDASKIEMESIASSSAQSKSVDPAATLSATSQPLTPATSLSSASRQIQSRTIRVVSTPKAENPPRLITASPSIVSVAPSTVASKQISRRASLSSIYPPGTPVSEKISDNASFTSTSMSRANSPPPSKVGSAPVRQYTKSQQRKERQVRARQAEEVLTKKEDSSTKAIAEEPVQAPIIGRKKKTRKPTRGTTESTPVATRPSSPTPKDEIFQDRTRPATPIKENYKEISVQKDAKESETPASPVASSSSDHHQKNLLSAVSILSTLQKSGEVSSTLLDLFKGAPGINFRFEINQQDLAEQNIPVLSDAQRRQIESGGAVVLDMINNKRVILLPDHSTLPGLTEEEAQRYLELRQRILSSTELAKFSSTRCDIAHYLHAGPQPANTAPPKPIRGCSAPEDLSVLINRFVASASAPALAAATYPPYFNSAPLTDEGMQRAKDVQFETAEQDMLASRKETEIYEKKFNGLLKRNRRLLVGNSS